jgi:hypothetical protein
MGILVERRCGIGHSVDGCDGAVMDATVVDRGVLHQD